MLAAILLPALQLLERIEVREVRRDLQAGAAERARREKNPAADLVQGAPVGPHQGAGEDERDRADGACAARRRGHAVADAAPDAVVGLIWRVKVTEDAQRASVLKSDP